MLYAIGKGTFALWSAKRTEPETPGGKRQNRGTLRVGTRISATRTVHPVRTRRLLLWAAVFVAAQVGDVLITAYLLGHGATEVNPVAARLLAQYGIAGLVVAKLGASVVFWAWLAAKWHILPMARRILIWVAFGWAVSCSLVVVWNAYWLLALHSK